MNMLLSFKAEVLASNKACSDPQTLQFKSLKDEMKKVTVQLQELKSENSLLKGEIDVLQFKITSFEAINSHDIHLQSLLRFCRNLLTVIVVCV